MVPSGIGLTGTKVNEIVTPQTGGTVCTSYVDTSDGALDANSQFSDPVELCSNSPIPACDKKIHADIHHCAVPPTTPVRSNVLEFTNNPPLGYTNQGPTK